MTNNEVHKKITSIHRWGHIEIDDVWEVGKWNDYEVFAGQGDGQGSAQFFLVGENTFREATNEEMLTILLDLNRMEKQKGEENEW